jgi:hypothetical protein
MPRHQFREIHDWLWCPKIVRNGLTDFLQASNDLLDTYEPIRTRLLDAIVKCGGGAVVDLCSGSGGPWVKWTRQGLTNVPIALTDKFPNLTTIKQLTENPVALLQYYPQPVDATAVPSELQGFRTIFTAFHHFTPAEARAIIDDAVRNRQGIGVFEFTSRTLSGALGMLLTPLGVWLFTPLMKKLRWQVLTLTYLLPVIPLVTCIDGVLSCLRSYTDIDLRRLANSADYEWAVGKEKGITYLIGVPVRRSILDGPQAFT